MRDKIYILDSLRGIIALLVAVYHFLHAENHHGRLIPEGNPAIEAIDPFLIGSVSVFFLISAYVIFLHLENHTYSIIKFGTFIFKRLVRIQIPVIICIGLIVLVNEGFNSYLNLESTFSWDQFLANISLSASFLGEEWYNPIFWTLAIEFQFYIFVGLVFTLINRSPIPSLIILGVAFIPLNYCFDTLSYACYYGGYFIIGTALYLFHQKRLSLLSLLIITAIAATDVLLTHEFLYPIIPLLSIPIILFVQKRSRLFEWLGEVSFSFYLMHGMFGGWLIYFTARYADNGFLQFLIILAALVVSYIGSYAFYRIIEKPVLHFSRKITYKK
ncbi:MAG: peptidoglycan/LPS O-acetylase OafA/YrhL [Flavobacteriaceae bacterium]|jgi:peptidoglycan/LPS O-acetylase OafA/YrhL